MKHFLLLTSCLLLVTTVHALTDPWSVNVNDHAAVQRTYKQGESWTMQISLRDGLKPLDLTGATARFYWYTNTVQNVWWTNSAAITAPKSGLVSAQWTPAMDTGASVYAYWVGLWMQGSTSPLWRVTGTIRMLTSPGFRPNEQQPPVRTMDFGAITVTNAPWVTGEDWRSGSNALATAIGDAARKASNYTDQACASIPRGSADALRLVDSTNAPAVWQDCFGRFHQVGSYLSGTPPNNLYTNYYTNVWSYADLTNRISVVNDSKSRYTSSLSVCGWFADQWAIENGTAVVYRVVVLPDFLMGGHTPWPQQATYDGGTPGIDLATPFPQALTNAGVWAALTNVHAVALAGTNQWIDGNGSVWREHPVTNWYAVPVNAEVYYDGVSYFPPASEYLLTKNLSGYYASDGDWEFVIEAGPNYCTFGCHWRYDYAIWEIFNDGVTIQDMPDFVEASYYSGNAVDGTVRFERRVDYIAQKVNSLAYASDIANATAPMLSRGGVRYRQYWDTNLLTTAWEAVQ